MATHRHASSEIIQFLKDLQDTPPDLPEAIVGYWEKTIEACKNVEFNKAEGFCKHMSDILRGLRSSAEDFRQTDEAQGQVSILLGAIHLGQQNWHAAVYYFEQGIGRLRYWGYPTLESLAYFGQALCYKERYLSNRKEKKNWPKALGAAQKALDTIRNLPIPNKSHNARELEERIRREIDSMTKVSTEESVVEEDGEKEVTVDTEIIERAEERVAKDIEEEITEGTKEKPPIADFEPIKPKSFTWIPIIGSIAAGEGIITKNEITDLILLDNDYHNSADFGVTILGNSMKNDGILAGDIAFIHRQSMVKAGEIAAVVIRTPEEIEPLGVLKRYYYFEKPGMQYWFLKSSNPSNEHLIVIPKGAKVEAIKNFFAREIQSGKIRNPIKYYENAELVIVGKYVGLVRRI